MSTKLTTNACCPVVDNQNVITEGPQLLQDVWFPEKLAHFDREVIPGQRIVQRRREIWIRHIGTCLKAGPTYGEGVAKALGIPMSEVP